MRAHDKYPSPIPLCPTCQTGVRYKDRKLCQLCRKWCHNHSCIVSTTCIPCTDTKPNSVQASPDQIKNLVYKDLAILHRLNPLRDADLLASLHIIYAAIYLCGLDETKLQAATGLSADFINLRANRLRENGIWSGDMLVSSSNNIDEEIIEFLLFAMCADGHVKWTSSGSLVS